MPHAEADKALAYFHQGYNCAQSVFTAFAEQMGLTDELALRLSSGFGAGVGRMRGMCGAFSGLTMVAGYCKGNLSGNPEEKEKYTIDGLHFNDAGHPILAARLQAFLEAL